MDKLLEKRLVSSRCYFEVQSLAIRVLSYDLYPFFFSEVSLAFLIQCRMVQHEIPAFTVPQPDEAMHVLEEKASQLDVSNSSMVS